MVNPGQGAFFVSNHIIPVRLWLRSAASIHSSPHTTIPGSTFLDSLHVLPLAGGSPFVSMPCLTTVCGRLCADECTNVVLVPAAAVPNAALVPRSREAPQMLLRACTASDALRPDPRAIDASAGVWVAGAACMGVGRVAYEPGTCMEVK